MCLIHILCRDHNMVLVAETARLWITSQQLNEHMTKRNKIKTPASHNSASLAHVMPLASTDCCITKCQIIHNCSEEPI